jgi:23S rRNA pseudouridine2604 synthase
METENFPMRINKYLAQQNYGTRRACDDLITAKKVYINGRLAKLGDTVGKDDKVEVKRHAERRFAYYAFNKPAGVPTHAEGKNTDSIVHTLPPELKKLNLFPVGRLDKDSHGLIILTNDGRVTDRLLNPKYAHEKEYEVRTKLPLRANFKQKIESGINIEGYITKPCKIHILGANRFRIILTEGKTHQIRRMCVALFNEVADLKRIRIMNIKLGALAKGGAHPIEGADLQQFLSGLQLI